MLYSVNAGSTVRTDGLTYEAMAAISNARITRLEYEIRVTDCDVPRWAARVIPST